MNFFYLLLLAHLVGDFPLQSDTIFRLKQKSVLGILVHVAIYAVVTLILFIPFLSYPSVWLAVFLLSAFHVALDRGKLLIANSNARDRFSYFLIDQVLHVLSLWIAGLWLSRELVEVTAPALYRHTRLLLILNSLIIAGFAGSLLLFYLEKTVLRRSGNDQALAFPKQRQRWPGITIRILATLGAILGGWYLSALLLIPVLVFLNPSWFNDGKPMPWLETLSSLTVCLACAAWVWLAG